MYKTKITIRGTVQHVGLRVQIKAIADGLGVCGTVENLRDGSVLVSCEAGRADIEEMVRQVRSGTELAVIKDVLVEEGPPATGMEGFEVIRGDSSEEMLSMMATGTKTMFGVLTTLKDMKQGQNQTNETLTELKQGQARLEKGQEDLKQGQNQTNEILTELKQGQARLEKGQTRLEKGQEDLKQGQAETTDAIKSMDGKLAASLENDAQSLEILKDLRDGGLLRAR